MGSRHRECLCRGQAGPYSIQTATPWGSAYPCSTAARGVDRRRNYQTRRRHADPHRRQHLHRPNYGQAGYVGAWDHRRPEPGAQPGAGADILAGKMFFDYTWLSPASAILTDLTNSYYGGIYPGAWDLGMFRTRSLQHPHARLEGQRLSKVTVMATLPGDANLDGSVGFSDLNTLIGNYGTGTTWAPGRLPL